MASLAKQFSCLIFLISYAFCRTEARESKFFSKYIHLTTNTNKNYVTVPSTNQITSVPAPAPLGSNYDYAPAPAPLISNDGYAPAPAPVEGHAPAPIEGESWFYGLYAKGTTDFSNHKEEEELSNEELSNGNPEELNNEESNTYDNGYSKNNYLSNDNALSVSNHKSYNTNNGYANYINGGYNKNEPQGMSDTRLMGNGKYYNNVGHGNYRPSGDELATENKNDQGYYYGNYQKSRYEFDSMEEYEREEGYPGVQQEVIP